MKQNPAQHQLFSTVDASNDFLFTGFQYGRNDRSRVGIASEILLRMEPRAEDTIENRDSNRNEPDAR